MHPVPWRAYALLAASTSLVGSYVGLSKLLVAAFPVFLLEIRNLLGVVLMVWAIVRVFRAPTERVARPKDLREWVMGRRSVPARVAAK